jgi:hypothetical protein
MLRIGAALDLRFGKNTMQFIDFLKKVDGYCTYILEMKAMPDIISGRKFIESLVSFSY